MAIRRLTSEFGTDLIAEGDIATGAVTTDKIASDAITSTKIATDAVTTTKILDSTTTTLACVTNSSTTVTHTTATLIVGTAVSGGGIPIGATIASVQSTTSFTLSATATTSVDPITLTFVTGITAGKIAADAVGTTAIAAGAIGATELGTTLDLSSHTVTVPAATVTAHVTAYDDNKIQTNLAILGMKVNATKYNLQDQVIDEFVDATGINTGDSTNELLTSGVYSGATVPTVNVTHGADATGTSGNYTWYKWTTVATEAYQTDTAQDHDYIVVAGGAGGGGFGGGGAGGFRTGTALSIGTSSVAVVVGVGGAGATSQGASGGVSTFATITSAGGGGGGGYVAAPGHNGVDGASGGGAGQVPSGAGGTGGAENQTPNQGFAGGDVNHTSANAGGGGGGAAAVGAASPSSTNGGAGGAGENNVMGMNDADSDTLLTAASAGHDVGGLRYFAGGGGGSGSNFGVGGNGGGGRGGGSAVAGTDGTGGGGGGGDWSAGGGEDGGDGIVIIRRQHQFSADLTLQSADTTAEAAPTTADLVMLVEDAGTGVGTINTHIKGWISRYETGGTKTWTQATLVDEGDWGTDKRILVAHDLDISGQASGTQMAYKITTHSASAVYDTKIHATSIGWK